MITSNTRWIRPIYQILEPHNSCKPSVIDAVPTIPDTTPNSCSYANINETIPILNHMPLYIATTHDLDSTLILELFLYYTTQSE